MVIDMNRFAELMNLSGVKQITIAKACNVSQPTVSAWKTGQKGMSLENAIAAANALGVTVGCLVGTEPIPEGYGTLTADAMPQLPQKKKAPAKEQELGLPFSPEQISYLEAMMDQERDRIAEAVSEKILEGISSSREAAGEGA